MSPWDKLRSAWVLQARIPLEPLSSRIRPAVFAKDKDEGGKLEPFLAEGHRYLGAPQNTVILDSPASMANRMEEALYALRAELGLNDIRVDFGDVAYSIWQLPHRIYDAAVRDSQWSDQEFFQTDLGKKLALGDPQALFKWSPNSLLFGSWNSHAQAGIGARLAPRIERAVLAEVLGLGPERVPRPGSRRDPLGIPGDATVTEAYMERAKELGIFKKDDKGDKEGEGEGKAKARGKRKALSTLGFGNVPPTLQDLDVSVQEGVLDFLCTRIPLEQRRLPEPAQGVLVLLGLLGLASLLERGVLHLRSGTALRVERVALRAFPGEEEFSLPPKEELIGGIKALLKELPEGWRWTGEELVLTPLPALKEIYEGQHQLRADTK
jgi:CRISPR-associated protein Csb1